MHTKLTRSRVIAMIVALPCAVAPSACGSSSKETAGGSQGNAFIAFSKCMRAHGITSFPDPSGRGGINLGGTGINPQSPSFRAAQAVCYKLLPGGGPAGQHASAQEIKQATETSECMRAHGVTGFPDPVVSTGSGPPDLSPAQYSSVEDRGGMIIAIPKFINVQSPAFVAAAKTCHFQ